MRINLVALLPTPDGTGWYAVQPTNSHLCSAVGCMRLAVAYHHAVYEGEDMWRNKYRCPDHMDENMEVRNSRVWVHNEPVGP
jgi:hypothetical protein